MSANCTNMLMDKKEYYKKYYLKNRKKLRAYHKNWWESNKEKISIKRRKDYEQNKDKYSNQKKRDYQTHKEKRLRYAEKYRDLKEVKVKNKAYQNEYRKNNKDKRKAYAKDYFKSENGKIVHRRNKIKRRCLENNCLFRLSARELKIITEKYKNCVYCEGEKDLTYEHIIPVNKGGESNFNNLVRACKICNSSKGDKDVFEWCKEKGISVPKIILELLKGGEIER